MLRIFKGMLYMYICKYLQGQGSEGSVIALVLAVGLHFFSAFGVFSDQGLIPQRDERHLRGCFPSCNLPPRLHVACSVKTNNVTLH